MKMRSFLIFTILGFVFFSCAGNPDAYAPIDQGIETGSYDEAIATINDEKGEARKSIYTTKNEILFYLDRGMIHHYAGQYRESSEDLEMAERLIEEAFTKSVSQEVGSFIMNDNTKDYAGEDYEDLYVNVFNALNYYHNNDIEGALIEVRRINEKLIYLADKYEAAKEKVLESNKQVDPNKLPVEATKYSHSALARYLGLLFYRGSGDPDNARIDYEELQKAYELSPNIYTNNMPSSVENELSVPPGKGRLNIMAFTGLSPVKEQEVITIPLPFEFPNNTAKLAFPKMVDRGSEVQTVELVLDSGEKFKLELLENMGTVAQETFKARYSLIVLKTTARAITKAAIAATSAKAANSRAGGLGSLVGLAGKIAADASEQADVRLGRYFPCYALVGGINLDPGNYQATVNYYGGGSIVHSESRDVEIRDNALNLEQFFYLK